MKRSKFISLLLSAAMILSLVSVPAAAADTAVSFNDMEGHWGTEAVDRWSSVGIFKGNGEGSFMPDKEMSRAEFAQMLVNLMGYTATSETKFADVEDGAWYADAISKLAAAGVMQGDGVNAMPNASISREQSAVLLCRALHLAPSKDAKISFADAGNVSSWAQDAVAALAERGMIAGVGDNNFAPNNDINRASVAQMVHNMVSSYVTEDGATVTGEQKGIVIIVAKDVKVENATITEPLILAPKAAGATVTLTGNTKAAQVVLSAEAGKAVVGKNVTVTNLTVDAAKTDLTVSGKVDNVTVAGTATETTLTVEKGATIKNVESAADKLSVKGTGRINNLTITGGEGVTVAKETKVDRIVNNSESAVKVGDKELAPGKSSNSSSGGGSGSSGGGSTAAAMVTVTYVIGKDTNSFDVEWGSDVTVPEVKTEGYEEKWTYTLGEEKYTVASGAVIESLTEDITLVAVKAADTKVTVTYVIGSDTRTVKIEKGTDVTVPEVDKDNADYYFTGVWTYTLGKDTKEYTAKSGAVIKNVTDDLTLKAESFKVVEGAWTVKSCTYHDGSDTAVYVKDGNTLTVYVVGNDTEVKATITYATPQSAEMVASADDMAGLYTATAGNNVPPEYTGEVNSQVKYLKWIDADGKILAVQKVTVTIVYTNTDPRA